MKISNRGLHLVMMYSVLFLWGVGLANYKLNEYQTKNEKADVAAHMKQLQPGDASLVELKAMTAEKNQAIQVAELLFLTAAVCAVIYHTSTRGRPYSPPVCCPSRHSLGGLCAVALMMSSTGCIWAPFEPIHMEVIQSNEYAFLIPFTDDVAKQERTANEEYLKKNMVYAKQVKMPQQWIATNYAWWGRTSMNGAWHDAALLLKVTNSPFTREWTADPMSGTGNKNEAVWVMTADQVEFSTGWTCTARVATEDDAVKFLHNYRNGSMEKVLDSEVRMKLAAEFALEVTDLPMDKLRKDATPHIKAVVERVKAFFEERGISITNLGITGGFVYKDPSVQETLVKVFNAEQGKNLAIAGTQTQEEQNKRIQLEATGKAEALLKESKAEADSIKMVADAKEYELKAAEKNIEVYMGLKRLEVELKKVEKWTGTFPTTYFGEKPPEMMLTVPGGK